MSKQEKYSSTKYSSTKYSSTKYSPINIMDSCESDSDSDSDSDTSTTEINDNNFNHQTVKDEMKEITEAVSILAEAIANINESSKNGNTRILTQFKGLGVSLILKNLETFSVLMASLNRIEKNSKLTNQKIKKTNQKIAKLSEKLDKLSEKFEKITDSLIT